MNRIATTDKERKPTFHDGIKRRGREAPIRVYSRPHPIRPIQQRLPSGMITHLPATRKHPKIHLQLRE